MPKRRNSFDDNHFLLKMRIGVKEVNLGVNSAENMKKVYETTQQTLFNGSAKSFNGCPKAGTKDLKMNANGLKHTMAQEPNGCNLKNNKGKSHEMNPCCNSNQNDTCSFCEKTICTSCYRTCTSCYHIFCSLCSVLRYDCHDESALCLSCR